MGMTASTTTERADSAYERASCLSKLSFSFVYPLLKVGAQKDLEISDLERLPDHDKVKSVTNRLEAEWIHELEARGAQGASLWRALYRAERTSFWVSALYCFGESCTRIGQPVLLGRFLAWLTSPVAIHRIADGLIIAALLCCVGLLQAIIHHQLYYFTMRGGWNARVACTALIHRKMLKVHSSALNFVDSSDSNMVNLISNDVFRFDGFFPRLHFGWSAPLDFFVVCGLMVNSVGWTSTLAGVSTVIIFIPIQICLGKRLAGIRKRTAKATDARLQTTSEVIDAIATIKVMAIEKKIEELISKLRSAERWSIFRAAVIKSFNSAIDFMTPYVATLLCFLAFWAQGKELSIATVFSTMTLLHVLRISVGKNFVLFIEVFPEAMVSVSRLQNFLMLPEIASRVKTQKGTAGELDYRVNLDDASFSWECGPSNSPNVVSSVSFRASEGQFVCISGSIASGKSACLLGILGELNLTAGSANINGSIAMVSQEPWIMTGSLKSNVMWANNSPAEQDLEDLERRFQWCLQATGLNVDIETWHDKENTLIGEKGVNLSGGQRARVALARAMFADADILLLDGVLSAVDATVSNKLLFNTILMLCREQNKTVILATHEIDLCSPYADVVVRLGADGTMSEVILSEHKSSDAHVTVEKRDENQLLNEANVGATESKATVASAKAIILKEERTLGSVQCSTYFAYLSSAGIMTGSMILLLFICGQAVAMLADLALERWADLPLIQQRSVSNNPNFHQFVGFTIAASISGGARAVLFYYVGLKASTRIHGKAFSKILWSPMHYFTSNPIGRILNKFSADQGIMDEILPQTLFMCISNLFLCLGAMILAVVAVPWAAAPLVPLLVILLYVRWYFLQSSRDLKRCEAISKSPMFVSFSENMKGRAVIRAFSRDSDVSERFEVLLSNNARCWYSWLNCNRWVGFRLDSLTLCLLTFVVFFGALVGWNGRPSIVEDSNRTLANRENASSIIVDHGLLAIAITYCIQLSGVFQYMIRLSAKVETQMVAVERLSHLTKLEPEHRDSSTTNSNVNTTSHHKGGQVVLDDIYVRYRKDLPCILKGVSLNIPAGTKVGLVGRSGSGKSTVLSALCYLNEISSGQISIDGVNLSSVPPHQWRSQIGVIPQVPSLFTGSIAFNVDPKGTHSADEIRGALDAVGLQAKSVDFHINGNNLSVGERQCICLARALLCGAKVYLIDEATANIDHETDAMIQKMLREHPVFASATVIVVAHRLKTIEDSDMIVVMDEGKIVERGRPSDLQKLEGGFYQKLFADSEAN